MTYRLALVILLCQLGWQGPASADAVCDRIFASYSKLSEVPAYRQTVRLKGAVIAEQMMVGNDLYTRDGNSWSKQSLEDGARKSLLAAVMADGASLKDCREGAEETVNGVDTRQYSYALPPMAGVGELGPQQVWIGTEDGLPHRLVAEKQGTETIVGFDGIKPPM